MLRLKCETPAEWVRLVDDQLESFLRDHAHNERKVAGSAMTLLAHHPNRPELVEAMTDLAREELSHFRAVFEKLQSKGWALGFDDKDTYMAKMAHALRRKDTDLYLLDRLLLFAVIEARGCERFKLLGDRLGDLEMRNFYAALARAEARHHALFLRLARLYFPLEMVQERLDGLLEHEASVFSDLPLRPALH
ncbi:MAG: tRNA isopentenyl-2-thiomethyl-A-37 hydroxylase MiaE [Myxococcota bacterium]|nr:tRNA isopentenyl-2-thiomethyl-A-37 hydroxylase MiaE [Myxococcota bacterium]